MPALMRGLCGHLSLLLRLQNTEHWSTGASHALTDLHGGMLQEGVYFQRIRFDLTDMVVGTANKAVLERAIAEVADRFGMEWRLFYDGAVKRVAILVSRLDHCLYDILIRHRAGQPQAP